MCSVIQLIYDVIIMQLSLIFRVNELAERNTPLMLEEKMETSENVSNGAKPAHEEKEAALR